MTEPTSAALAAATAITTGTLTLAGSFYGIPADSMLAATLGAGIAMASAPRVGAGRAAIFSAMGVFVTSLSAAVFLGPLVGIVADGMLGKLTEIDLPDGPVRAAAALLVGMGAQRWLPAVLARMTGVIEAAK
jgi:hypothetical protein